VLTVTHVLAGLVLVMSSLSSDLAGAAPPQRTYVFKPSSPYKYYDKHGNAPPSCGKAVSAMISYPLVTVRYGDRVYVNGVEWRAATAQADMFSAISPRSTRDLQISIAVHLHRNSAAATILALGLEDLSEVHCADVSSYSEVSR
jgi:hypothetical protein